MHHISAQLSLDLMIPYHYHKKSYFSETHCHDIFSINMETGILQKSSKSVRNNGRIFIFIHGYLAFATRDTLPDKTNLLENSIFSSTGRRPASLCHGPLSVCASVRALTFSLNIFFSETTYRILMKFHRNFPTMVLFRIS